MTPKLTWNYALTKSQRGMMRLDLYLVQPFKWSGGKMGGNRVSGSNFSLFFLLSIFTLIHSPCFIWINCLACVLNSGENIYLFFLGGRIWRHWVLHLNILAWFIHFACVRIYMMLAALKSSTRRKTRFSSPTSFSSRDGSIMRLIGAIQLCSSCNSLGTVSGPWVRVCPEVIELAMLSPLS